MKKSLLLLAGCTVLAAAFAAPARSAASDGEVWNEGVDYYRAGDVTNALRVLRPLLLSRTHGARAAEVVAKLEHERGEFEEAASAAQIALRAAPGDAKANRNFTRCIDRLPSLRAARHHEEVMKASQGKDPGALLLSAAKEAREVMSLVQGLATNSPERAVALADSLCARAGKLADVWLPVREAISGSVTNEEQAATIMLQLDAAKAKTEKAAKAAGDFDAEAYPAMADAEHDFNRFLKLTIAPPSAVEESLTAQSNAWQDVAEFNGRGWQREALDFTRAFRRRFPAWARAYEQQAQSDTNKPPFTAETQAKISALATEVEKLQLECVEKSLPPNQEEAIGKLIEIRELLPKDGSSSQNQSGDSGQPQQNQSEDQKNDQPPEDDGKDEGQSRQNNEEAENEKEELQPDEGGSEPDEEVETVLKKAQERSDEHEEEKKARMRRAPLPPNARDW
jgi:hypothetical protein